MTEQQEHLKNLLKQSFDLKNQIESNEKLYWKVQGAIEYLEGIGVSLSNSNESSAGLVSHEVINSTEDDTQE